MPKQDRKPTRQDYIDEGAKWGATVGAVGGGILGAVKGGVWGAAIGVLAGGLAGGLAGATYGAAHAWWDGVGTEGSGNGQGDGNGGSEEGCFVRGTLVVTAAGMTAIELVEPDTKVYSLNFAHGDYRDEVLNPVGQTFESNRASLIVLGIGTEGDETIRCTPQHRFYTDRWISARHLRRGDQLLAREGRRVELRTVGSQVQQQSVFNLGVPGTGNYFVGRSQVLVHNLKKQGNEEPGDGDN